MEFLGIDGNIIIEFILTIAIDQKYNFEQSWSMYGVFTVCIAESFIQLTEMAGESADRGTVARGEPFPRQDNPFRKFSNVYISIQSIKIAIFHSKIIR